MLKPNQKSKISKKSQVEKMFDTISFEYDFLNGIMTFNSHKRWKKNILNIAKKLKPKNALDIATGTADIAIDIGSIPNCQVVGIDISQKMKSQSQWVQDIHLLLPLKLLKQRTVF